MTTLGVVYGDIGTSPPNASRACFNAESGLAATGSAVYGVLSLTVRGRYSGALPLVVIGTFAAAPLTASVGAYAKRRRGPTGPLLRLLLGDDDAAGRLVLS